MLALKQFLPSRSGVPYQADRTRLCILLIYTWRITKVWWFYTSLPPSLRQSSSPATQEKVPEGYLAKFHKQKLFFLKRLLGPHIRQIRQGCASYSYTPRLANQRNMLVANIFARARAHTPPPARQVGFFFSFFFFFFFFFSEAPLRPASIKPGRMVHLYRAHTAHPKHLVFCKSLDANPVEKKKKNSEFRTFLAHCGTWHG